MNKQIAITGIIAFLLSSSLSAQSQVQHGDMKLVVPGETKKETIDLGDGTIQHRLILNQPNGSIIVWYQAANPAIEVSQALKKAQDTIVKLAGGVVVSEKSKNEAGINFRSFTVTMPSKGGEFRVAYYYFEGKNYQVMSVGIPEFTRSKQVDKMFQSVQFGNQKG